MGGSGLGGLNGKQGVHRKGACPSATGACPLPRGGRVPADAPPPPQFRYKTRVYKQTNLDEKQLAKLHTKVGPPPATPLSPATPPLCPAHRDHAPTPFPFPQTRGPAPSTSGVAGWA